jgi:hypothetical protein
VRRNGRSHACGKDSEARLFRSTRRSSLSNSRFASRALALSTSARAIQSLPSRVTDLFFLLPHSLSGCATRSAGCARTSVPLSQSLCIAIQSRTASAPGKDYISTDNEVWVAAHLLPRLLPRMHLAAVASGCTIMLYHRANFQSKKCL